MHKTLYNDFDFLKKNLPHSEENVLKLVEYVNF